MFNRLKLFLILSVALSVGCGKPNFYKLSGKVTKDDKPIPHVIITLVPDLSDSTRPPTTMCDAEGNFNIKTGRNIGVPPGSYTITIKDPSRANGESTPKESDAFFEDYMYVIERYSPENSDLKYQADQHRTSYDLKLDTKEYTKEKVPLRKL